WVESCDQMNIEITAKEARPFVDSFRSGASAGGTQKHIPRRNYTREAFRDAICEFLISDDQAINTIENPKLRAIFLMLKRDLKDSDIPHRNLIRERIMEMWEEHLDALEEEFAVCYYFFRRILLTYPLGYITMDAAGNNDTALQYMERQLRFRRIPFSKRQARIW
ncbi:hypothetical protein K435DRAFT_703544, partial [Dendrothele bispora CBS 962.96]